MMKAFVRMLALAAAVLVAAPGFAQEAPDAMVKRVSQDTLATIRSDPLVQTGDQAHIRDLIEVKLVPHFDFTRMTALAMGRNWRTATPEQQKRFVGALYRALLKTYGGAIADFTADRLKLLPFRGDPAATQATVRTLVTRSSGAAVPVDYRLRKTADGWKAFDVIIEGISYVKNYRTDLGAEVSAKGLEAVITRLEHEGLEVHISTDKPAATAGKH